MRPVDILRKKRDGHALEPAEIDAFIHGVTTQTWPDYQISALLMAIVLNGMKAEETANLTRAMVYSGQKLDLSDLPGVKVDKHSTGGVGDKLSLILAPLAAACGVTVPMMSGRGLGHTGGTLDKLESIPGFRVGLSLPEFRAALEKVGCALIGQTGEIAPADKILYALRDVTATVESIPLITASIMSKKIAEGIDALVLDVKCGRGAFMKNRTDARKLAESLVATGNANGVRTQALITAMESPLGRAVGNALEVIESLETLKGRGPSDVEALSVALAARMVLVGGRAKSLGEAETKVAEALRSGQGLEKFRQIIAHQGGHPEVVDDYSRLPIASKRALVRSDSSGYVGSLNAELLGRATMVLGAGRDRVEDAVDHSVGAILVKKVGDVVQEGEMLVELHYNAAWALDAAMALAQQAFVVEEVPPPHYPQILESLG
ncbi:MAG TPA: thymidine phosphorylase, partial [Gemmataceae bacterium]|nr:thymidine phosphorylase [Gemmataceae bacterium]